MNSIEKAIKLKQQLDTLRPLRQEDEARIMQKFRLDWNYHSNNLEGNTLTYGETKALILFNITAQGKPLKDHLEITGHNEAIKWIIDIVKEERPISENFIRELHQLILKAPYETDAITPDGKPSKKRVNIGVYKSSPNHVKTNTGEIFRFATPEETPALMADLIKWYRKKSGDTTINPILLAAEFHYKFIRIHPFDDGNGRTARILMNFILLKFGYPPVIIKTEDKNNYFSTLRQADAGILSAFIEYIASNLVQSLELMIRGAKGEDIEDGDDLEKEIALLEQRFKAIESTPKVAKKNIDLVLTLFEKSILNVLALFQEKGKLFDRFYDRSFLFINTDHARLYNSQKDQSLDQLKNKIDDAPTPEFIRLGYVYEGFKQSGFKPTTHESSIIFFLKEDHYLAINRSDISIKKDYHIQLKEEEIHKLINAELKRHQREIEEKIEQKKN